MATIKVEQDELETELEVEIRIGENLPPTHMVRILWGSKSHRRMNADDPVCEYRFASKELLDAFMQGVDESSGFMEYEIVTDDDIITEDEN